MSTTNYSKHGSNSRNTSIRAARGLDTSRLWVQSQATRQQHCSTACDGRRIQPDAQDLRRPGVEFISALVQPPFSPTPRAQPLLSSCNGMSAAIKRPKTRTRVPPPGGRAPSLSRVYRGVGLGFSMVCGESPQKMGWWGAKRVDEKQKARLTISSLSLPQLTQIDSKIFFTFTMKPAAT
jgi:hypothetical protein